MNTILIATDFSVTALHAATYICKLSQQLKPKKIILYYALENINPDRIFITDILAPSADIIAAEKEEAMRQLNNLKEIISPLLNSNISIETFSNDHTLIDGINGLIRQKNIDLVGIGISGKGNQNKNVIGSNTLRLMRECMAPLLVVPSKVDFKPIHKLMLAWDHKDTKQTLPVFSLTAIVQALQAKLFVVYIDNNSAQTAAEIVEEGRDLHFLLKPLNPEVHSPKQRSVTEGLLQFVDEHEINLMAIVPKKASFLEEFFNRSSTQKIALRTEIPMLILRK
jgi:nucleotide-binding universal stress UspA family protein